MVKFKKEVLYKLFGIILLLAVLFIFSVLFFYTRYFPGEITSQHDRWAQFGTFIGGVVTPVFSFLTFLGFLFTIVLQRSALEKSQESLNLAKQELEETKLANMIYFVHEEINTLYSKEVTFISTPHVLGYFFSSSAPRESLDGIPQYGYGKLSGNKNDKTLLRDLRARILELLNEYEENFGKSALTFYYKNRHKVASDRLCEKGMIKPINRLSAFANIDHYDKDCLEKEFDDSEWYFS